VQLPDKNERGRVMGTQLLLAVNRDVFVHVQRMTDPSPDKEKYAP